MKVLLDLDGVLVNFVKGAETIHGLSGFYSDPQNHGNWHFDKASGLSGNQFWGPLGTAFWAGLPWMEDGKAILDFLERKYGEHNICVLTTGSVSNQAECIVGKVQWLNQHLPNYKFWVGTGKEFCAHSNAILIDDKDSNVNDFLAEGGDALLVPRLWNSQHRQSHRTLDYIKEKLYAR